MDFDHENVRLLMNDDRLSSLPVELIHQILSCIDTKTAVQTCSLSSRWKFLWKSVSCLNFSSGDFSSLSGFSKFVNHVLSNRYHRIDLTSVSLTFRGAANELFVSKIADYAFAHNVQELNVVIFPQKSHAFPPSLFSSQSLRHFTFKSLSLRAYLVPKTAWNFPALTTLHLQEFIFRDGITDHESCDLFSKCVNLKDLKLHLVHAEFLAVFDIITPKLSNLTLTNSNFRLINLVAPELENLTVMNCTIQKLNAPSGLHSLNKASIYLPIWRYRKPYTEQVACKTIYMLHEIRSARFLTLNADVFECISSFPELLSQHPPPFKNLIWVKIDTSMRREAHKIKMSAEARNFLLENSPNATFIMEIPEAPLTRSMKLKEVWERKKAKMVADFESHLTELQASIEVATIHIGLKDRVEADFDNLMAEIAVLKKQVNEYAEMQLLDDHTKGKVDRRARARINACAREMRNLVDRKKYEVLAIISKKDLTRSLLETFPKRQRAEIEARYSRQIQESESRIAHLSNEHLTSKRIVDAYVEFMSSNIVMFPDVSSSNISLASQPSSSTLATIPTPSTSNIDSIP